MTISGKLTVVALVLLSWMAASAPNEVRGKDLPLLRFDDQFKCQVCHKFCNEYEKKIKEKKGDIPFHSAVQNARGNTSSYLWDEKHKILRPVGQGIGEPVIAEIYSTLDDAVLTHYNGEVILHALHAAAHLQRPPEMNAVFCQRVLCTEHLDHCPAHPDKRPFGEMTKAYRHFVEEFDRHQNNPQKDRHRRLAETRSGIFRSQIHQRYTNEQGHFDPASFNEEQMRKLQDEYADAERKARVSQYGEDL